MFVEQDEDAFKNSLSSSSDEDDDESLKEMSDYPEDMIDSLDSEDRLHAGLSDGDSSESWVSYGRAEECSETHFSDITKYPSYPSANSVRSKIVSPEEDNSKKANNVNHQKPKITSPKQQRAIENQSEDEFIDTASGVKRYIDQAMGEAQDLKGDKLTWRERLNKLEELEEKWDRATKKMNQKQKSHPNYFA
eukprot:GHVH01003880.1.p3 GENE.GHVH01003880.1~~GHVH01003880.1.p3  ORF type:complete len:192 (-),score=43.63 GHVH01003880.1:7-582(-)